MKAFSLLITLLAMAPTGSTGAVLLGSTPVHADSIPGYTLVDSCRVAPLSLMGMNSRGDVLLLTDDGNLLKWGDGSDELEHFDSALVTESWPEAVCADGPDWLILQRSGREVLRIGRRGEALFSGSTPEGVRWRDLKADRAGRIWLAELRGGRLVALGRGGQVLVDWNLEELLPSFAGSINAWCPDDEGGLILLEAGTSRLFSLSAVGNLTIIDMTVAEDSRTLLRDESRLISLAGGQVAIAGNGRGRIALYTPTTPALLILAREQP